MINDLLLGGCVVCELIGSMCRVTYTEIVLYIACLTFTKKSTDERNLLIRKIIIKGKSNFINLLHRLIR